MSAQLPEAESIYFETGTSLVDPTTGLLNRAKYPANSLWNRVRRYRAVLVG